MNGKLYGQICELFCQAAQASTSSVPEAWTPENPLLGHCAVASLVVRDVFGGDTVNGCVVMADGGVYPHCWNHIAGRDWDFTAQQLAGFNVVAILKNKTKAPGQKYAVPPKFQDTYRRYVEFRSRTFAALSRLAQA